MNKITLSALALIAIGSSLFVAAGPFAKAAEGFAPGVGPKGSISVPAVDSRNDWAALGTYAIAGDDGTSDAARRSRLKLPSSPAN